MPIIKSQVKRLRKSKDQYARNQAVRSEIKTCMRKFREACESSDKDAANREFLRATKIIDKAVSKGIVHKNNAANKKSKMARRFNSL